MDDISFIIAGIFVLFCLLFLTVFFLFYVLGITKPIDVGAGVPPIRKAVIAYKFEKGPYKNSGSLFTEVCRVAPDFKPIGIYYDDPKVVPAEKCRYAVGAILAEGDVKPDPEIIQTVMSEGFRIITLPELSHCVKTTFPFLSTLSVLIAVWRVYPKLDKYIKEHKLCAYPFLEIYESSTIHFMAPLSQQNEFFVKEALDCVPEEYNHEENEDSLLDRSDRSSPASSTRSSRSFTSFSRSGVSCPFGDQTFDDYSDNEAESDTEDATNVTSDSIQDDEVSSSIDVRPSKACTNLLEKMVEQVCSEENATVSSPGSLPSQCDTSRASLQDSGICSGRTSAVPTESGSLMEFENTAEREEDSSSSFEEINMESVSQGAKNMEE